MIANLVGLGTRPGEAESLVGPELAEDAVAGGAEGDGQDEADGEQLDGDLLEGTEALGDGVGGVLLLRDGRPHLGRGLQAQAPHGLLGAEDGGGALPEHVEGAGRLHCECV